MTVSSTLTTPTRMGTKEQNRRYYLQNKELYLHKSKQQKVRLREWVDKIKSVPCHDCGNIFPPYVMDFDHRDPKMKKFTIGGNLASYSRRALEEEISKCDIVCANCHRIRTHG